MIAKAYGRIGSAHQRKGDLQSAVKFFQKSLTEHRTPDILNKLRMQHANGFKWFGVDVDGAEGLGRIEDAWTLDGLTTQVYGVPKVQAGKDANFRPDRKADPETAAELGASQRQFLKLLYNLLIGKDTGPRLPTLLLAVGPQRLRELVTP